MKLIYLIILLFFYQYSFSQDIKEKLASAVSSLQADEQFKHSIISVYVVLGNSGKLVYEKNSSIGVAPASCQKIVTSASAFELLGNDYRYTTSFGYSGNITGRVLNGNLYMTGNGDPSLGSSRWKSTREELIIQKIKEGLTKLNIESADHFIIDNSKWGTQTLPGGWPWEDIGQYYGAGCSAFNWNENQYDILLKPGKKTGDSVQVVSVANIGLIKLVNELTTGAKGSGDQVYVYNAAYSPVAFLRGTAPVGIDTLRVAAGTVDGVPLFENKLRAVLLKDGAFSFQVQTNLSNYLKGESFEGKPEKTICDFVSPPLDSLNYWFLKKSINLYGEAFVKTIAFEKTNTGSTDSGINIIKDFWAKKGIEKSAMKIIDGSGLSPANRITTEALVKILQYAQQRPWFSSFYNALPEMNGIKMKDGYIGGVRAYTGYIKSAAGTTYSFSFIVNNFDGNPGAAREKIWKVLDLLK